MTPSSRPNPFTDRQRILHILLRRGQLYLHTKCSLDPFTDDFSHVRSCAPQFILGYFFRFFVSGGRLQPEHNRAYVKRRLSAQECAFLVLEQQTLVLVDVGLLPLHSKG